MSKCITCGSTNVGGVGECEYCKYVARARAIRKAVSRGSEKHSTFHCVYDCSYGPLNSRCIRCGRQKKEKGSAAIHYLFAVVCVGAFLLLIQTASAFQRTPAVVDSPVDYEHIGSEPEYVHGPHCIDSRSF